MRAFPLPPTSLSTPKRPSYRAWLASATWLVGSIAGATVAMANVPVGQWSTELSPTAAAAPSQSSDESRRAIHTQALTPRFKSTCHTCGVVETIRTLNATASTPAGYEFTVRLRDGTTRVSNDASAGKWRVGESIMLIGGDAPSSNTSTSL